jgi:hypothetical protein
MALLIPGKTRCVICGRVIAPDDPSVCTPAVISNQKDVLYRYSDACFHESCVAADEGGRAVLDIAGELTRRTGPGARACEVCGEQVLDPDDYVSFGYLGGDPSVAWMNFLQFHRSHLHLWSQRDRAVLALDAFREEWEGPGLPYLIDLLTASRSDVR